VHLGQSGGLGHGHHAGAGALEGAAHGEGVTAARINSGEQSRGQKGSNGRIKGASRFLTSSANSGARGGRRRCGGTSGRWRRGSGCAITAPVSAGRANQRGRAHRMVSQAANGEAELTEAKDGAWARR
jgi:hypothetical protein